MDNKKVPFYKDKNIKFIDEDAWQSEVSVITKLGHVIKKSLKVSTEDLDLQVPADLSNGDFSTNIALKLAKKLGKQPMVLANQITDELRQNNEFLELVQEVNVAEPGFINITTKNEFALNNLIESTTEISILKGKRIMVEFAHPNPFKAFHIGHLRNIILGESIIRLLEKLGAGVIRTNYQGDVGMHIAKCLWAFKKVQESDYPVSVTDRVRLIAKCYTDGAKAFDDPSSQEEIKEINRLIYTKEDVLINKLWETGKRWSLDKFHEIYKRVDSKFDREYMESETLQFVDEEIKKGKEKGILTQSQGALIFDGSKYGIDTRVYMNNQGLPTYEGKQLGLVPTMEFKDFGKIDLLIFNVAVEQISYFKSTIKAIELIYPELEGKQYHNAYEFVGLKSGKMSSRTGNVVLGEDIINEAVKKISEIIKNRVNITENEKKEIAEIIGIGAIKYSFLNISPGSYLAFDIDKSLSFEGNSGPYIQYTYTRANKVVRDYGRKIKSDFNIEAIAGVLNETETLLIKKLLHFSQVIIDSAKNLAPNILATYLFELSQQFNNFYKFNSILKAENQDQIDYRVYITSKVRDTLQEGLRLLGIKVPSVM